MAFIIDGSTPETPKANNQSDLSSLHPHKKSPASRVFQGSSHFPTSSAISRSPIIAPSSSGTRLGLPLDPGNLSDGVAVVLHRGLLGGAPHAVRAPDQELESVRGDDGGPAARVEDLHPPCLSSRSPCLGPHGRLPSL